MKTLLLWTTILLISCTQSDSIIDRQINTAYKHFDNQNYPEVILTTDSIISIDPNNYEALVLKGRALFNLDEIDSGITYLSKAIQINPQIPETYSHRAVMYNFTRDYDLAIEDMNVAIDGDPKNMEYLNIRGGLFFKITSYDKALHDYNYILDSIPDNYNILVYRATIYRIIEDYEKATKDIQKAIELDPENELAYEERAYLKLMLNNTQGSINDYSLVIEKLESNSNQDIFLAYTYNNRGFAYYKSGDHDRALADINYSIELFPNNSYAYKNRALIFIAKNELIIACSDLEKATELGYDRQYDNEVFELKQKYCDNKN